jgi:DNA-directed RNA polymerase specialized sigma24 family protein
LVKITDNKARQLARGERRGKRGGGKVRGDSVFFAAGAARGGGFDQLAAAAGELAGPGVEEPTEAFVDQLLDTLVDCYGSLDDLERKVLRGQLQGHTHAEIAEQIGCVSRTVERKLKVIRNRWGESAAE